MGVVRVERTLHVSIRAIGPVRATHISYPAWQAGITVRWQPAELNVDGKDGSAIAALGPLAEGKKGTAGFNDCIEPSPARGCKWQGGGQGQSASDTENAGMHGKPGDPGKPGGTGGSIFLVCESFPRDQPLILSAKGGRGGMGQQGQDGAKGGDGGDGSNNVAYTGFMNFGYKNPTPGGNGGMGGDGGRGGKGGNGGNGGRIVFRSKNEKNLPGDKILAIADRGLKGDPGQGGRVGAAGNAGRGGALVLIKPQDRDIFILPEPVANTPDPPPELRAFTQAVTRIQEPFNKGVEAQLVGTRAKWEALKERARSCEGCLPDYWKDAVTTMRDTVARTEDKTEREAAQKTLKDLFKLEAEFVVAELGADIDPFVLHLADANKRRRFSIGNDGALRNLEISDQSLQLSRMAGRRLPAGFPQWLATFLS